MKLKPDDDHWLRPLKRAPLDQASRGASSSRTSALPSLFKPSQAAPVDRRAKELSFTDVLRKHKLLPDSQYGVGEAKVRPCNLLSTTRQSVSTVGWTQDKIQTSRPEVHKQSKPQRPIRRHLSPLGQIPDKVQTSKPEVKKVSKPQRTTTHHLSPLRIQDEVQPSRSDVAKVSRPQRTTGLMQDNTEPSKPKGRKVKASKAMCPAMHESQSMSDVNGAPPTSQLLLEEPSGFSHNVFVVSMPEAVGPVEAATGTRSHHRDVTRSTAPIKTGRLLARRAQKNALMEHLAHKPPVAPPPRMFPTIAQSNMFLVKPKSSKKKHKKGAGGYRYLPRSSLAQRCVPLDLEVDMMIHPRVKTAFPSTESYYPWDEDDVLDIDTLRRTWYMCPMYEQEEGSGTGNKMPNLSALCNVPFRARLAMCNFKGRRRIMLPKDY